MPPPAKWHGLADVEARYRQRYLDLMANPEVRQVMGARSAMVAEIRRFLDSRGYVEVETPMMQSVAGGAAARPFVTHHNALDMDLFLRIAPELYLKRLVVGGFERVFEINRNFRNEGVSSMHNPEFTMLEFYTAYFDCADVMNMTEALLAAAATRVAPGGCAVSRPPVPFDSPVPPAQHEGGCRDAAAREGLALSRRGRGRRGPPPGVRHLGRCSTGAGITRGPLLAAERYRGLSFGKLLAQLFEDLAEGSLFEPTFVTDYPVEISPLAKARPDVPELTERFELFIAGMEVANGFSELNDPLEQRARFLDQLAERERGDAEAHAMDEDFVRALGHGLPPTGGCGVGIDRLAMILTGKHVHPRRHPLPADAPRLGSAEGRGRTVA